jgi:hypothetical protein
MYTCWLYFMNWKLPSFNKRIQLQNKDCQDLTCYIYIKKTFLNILIDIIYNFAKNSYQPLTSQHNICRSWLHLKSDNDGARIIFGKVIKVIF